MLLSCIYTHTHTHTHTLSLSLSVSLSLSHTHTLSLTHTHKTHTVLNPNDAIIVWKISQTEKVKARNSVSCRTILWTGSSNSFTSGAEFVEVMSFYRMSSWTRNLLFESTNPLIAAWLHRNLCSTRLGKRRGKNCIIPFCLGLVAVDF
jgi:hypothetical protein